jgi:hypothetical protein
LQTDSLDGKNESRAMTLTLEGGLRPTFVDFLAPEWRFWFCWRLLVLFACAFWELAFV